jgi:hypothetical protein
MDIWCQALGQPLRVRIVNVKSRDEWNLKGKNLLEHTLAGIAEGDDRRKINYSGKRLDLENHLAFDLLLDAASEEVLAFCGVYNGGRYPKGVFRVLNRVYVHPKFRNPKGLFEALGKQTLLSQTLLPFHLWKYSDEIKTAFVSREAPLGRHFLKRWLLNNAPDQNWQMKNDLVHVAPGGKDQSCFQFVVYRQFEGEEWAPPTIGESDWKNLIAPVCLA